MLRQFGRFVFAAFIAASGNAFAGVIFTDATFSPSDYSATTAFISDAGVSVAASQCASCGNSGAGLEVVVTVPTSPGSGAIGLINTTFSYDPGSQGPIMAIDAAVDKNLTLDFASTQTGTGTFGNTFRPLIAQDGLYYLAAIPGAAIFGAPFSTGYISFSGVGLLATDFFEFDFATATFGTAHPNFAGNPIQFGIGQISGIAGLNSVDDPYTDTSITADYDNLRISVVPEPMTLALLGIGLAGLGFSRRKH